MGGAPGSALKLLLAALHSTQRVDVLPPVSHLPVLLEVRGQKVRTLSGIYPLNIPLSAFEPARPLYAECLSKNLVLEHFLAPQTISPTSLHLSSPPYTSSHLHVLPVSPIHL